MDGSHITITEYSGDEGYKHETSGRVGTERSPTGELVTETSAYGRVRFDIKSIINGTMVTKTKNIFCTLEINN